MPPAQVALHRILLAIAALQAAFTASGCGPETDVAVPVDHRMGFLADSLREPRTGSLAEYLLHPPAWARIHRDSLCLAVDSPDSTYKVLALEIILRNPRTGDSLGYGWTVLSTLLSNRNVSCLPVLYLGRREAWQGPVAVEMILTDAIGRERLATRKLVVDPRFDQLDLHPFRVRFFPDRVGMEWLVEGTVDPGDAFRGINRLVSWALLPEDPRGFCPDTVVQLRYHYLDCAPGDSTHPDADLLRCSAALDSALAVGPPDPSEAIMCAVTRHARVDSALLYNGDDGYGLDNLFGRQRATYHFRNRFDGDSTDMLYAEGLGVYSLLSVDSARGTRDESRILSVK